MSDPSAPIRVAHIEMGSHLYGGAQQVLYLLEALSSSDVTSTLICPVGSAIGKAARERGVAVEEVGYRGDLDWMVLPKIKLCGVLLTIFGRPLRKITPASS